jgi:hypothetical protein
VFRFSDEKGTGKALAAAEVGFVWRGVLLTYCGEFEIVWVPRYSDFTEEKLAAPASVGGWCCLFFRKELRFQNLYRGFEKSILNQAVGAGDLHTRRFCALQL